MSIDALPKSPRTDTRQRILDVAAHLFATRGFAGTSIRDIADEIGVTKAALYYHFASKDVLLHEIVSLPLMAVRDAVGEKRDLSTAAARKQFVSDVVGAMSTCEPDVVTVFKDPSVAPSVDHEVAKTGITHQLSLRLAAGLSGATEPGEIKPEHLIRAIAAVAAGYEAINNWQVVYPECKKFSAEDVDVISGFVSDILEAGQP